MGPDGTESDYIQENKERDPDFADDAGEAAEVRRAYVLTVGYSGKEAVRMSAAAITIRQVRRAIDGIRICPRARSAAMRPTI